MIGSASQAAFVVRDSDVCVTSPCSRPRDVTQYANLPKEEFFGFATTTKPHGLVAQVGASVGVEAVIS